jgi:hypothetical protein
VLAEVVKTRAETVLETEPGLVSSIDVDRTGEALAGGGRRHRTRSRRSSVATRAATTALRPPPRGGPVPCRARTLYPDTTQSKRPITVGYGDELCDVLDF